MKKLNNLALSLLLALVMVAGALPGVAQKADAASGVDVYIDVGAGHADLFTSDVLNQIKTEFLLQDATIEGNIITLKGVHPNNVEAELRIGIHNVVGLLISDSGYRHNGEELIDVAYKAIDDYATFQDYVDDTYNDAHETTNVSDGMTYYLLWKKPYEKLELDNGSPTCGKQASEAMPTIPDAFTLLEFETHWKDENNDSVETFEGGKKYTLKGVLEFQRSSGDFWKYYVPDDFVLTVEGGTGVECSVIVGTYIEFSFTATADHKWDAGKVTIAATCTSDGEKTYTCTACEATKTETIKASDHKYGAWTKLDANQHQKVCKHNKSHVVKENHKWDAGKVTKKATEKATGIKTYTCSVCKTTKTETIPKLKPSTPKVSGTPLAKMSTKGKTSLVLTWNKIQGAAGYDIFFTTCGKDSPKRVKTIKGNKTFKWTKTGLKKSTPYKAYVKAYVMKNGKKTYVRTSPMVHAYTGGQTKNYTNAKSVTVKKNKVTLKKGKTYKIKASINKVNKKKKLMPKSHAPTLRYMTSNSKVATVSKSGMITAKGKGSCYIYVLAHNGVSRQVKVTVP